MVPVLSAIILLFVSTVKKILKFVLNAIKDSISKMDPATNALVIVPSVTVTTPPTVSDLLIYLEIPSSTQVYSTPQLIPATIQLPAIPSASLALLPILQSASSASLDSILMICSIALHVLMRVNAKHA